MPIPVEYQHASDDFHRFLRRVMEESGLSTSNQAYTTVQGVLYAFRRRLSVKQAILFAGVLRPIVRAIFVADWDVDEPVVQFGDVNSMTEEVQALRRDHNFSPATSIRDVSRALRESVDHAEFERVLAMLPEGANEFWSL